MKQIQQDNMKKIMTMLAFIVLATVSADAQVMNIYKGNKLVASFSEDEADRLSFDEYNPLGGEEMGRQYVDLGLPSKTLWAACNIGADVPYDSGDYIAWGEKAGKSFYTFETYLWSTGSAWYNVNKYTFPDNVKSGDWYDISGVFHGDNKRVLDKSDDAASAVWRGSWRIPTAAEFSELVAECVWTRETRGDVEGYRFVGPSRNSIFLPLAGGVVGRDNHYAGLEGYYWTSELGAESDEAKCLMLTDKVPLIGSKRRHSGLSIRPVVSYADLEKDVDREGESPTGIFVWASGSSTCYLLSDVPHVAYVDGAAVLTIGDSDTPELTIELEEGAQLMITYGMYDEVSTGVDDSLHPQQPTKVQQDGKYIRGGRLIIVKDGRQYDVSGVGR